MPESLGIRVTTSNGRNDGSDGSQRRKQKVSLKSRWKEERRFTNNDDIMIPTSFDSYSRKCIINGRSAGCSMVS